jgi:DNA-binding CsgD family transcriptional regulator
MFFSPNREIHVLLARELLDRGLVAPVASILDQLRTSPLADTPCSRLIAHALTARIAVASGDEPGAEHGWRQLLVLATEQGARAHAIDALEGIAAQTAVTAPAHAARLLGAADAAREAIGYRFRFPRDQRRLDDARSAVRQVLSLEAFAEGWAEGRALELTEAAAYAQRMRGRRRRPQFGWTSLSPTELAVARLIASGESNPTIARKLVMSINTVKTHVASIYAKLGVRSRAEVAALVVRHTAAP